MSLKIAVNDLGSDFLPKLNRAVLEFANFSTLSDDNEETYSTLAEGDLIRTKAEGYVFRVAASTATDHHLVMGASGVVKLYVVSVSPNQRREITLPVGFEWFSYKIWAEPDGSASTDLDFEAQRITPAVTYYVRHTGGSDSNDGLTFATGFATIAKALTMSTSDDIKILLQAGTYFQNRGCWGVYTPTRNVEISVIGDGVATILGSNAGLSWSKTIGRNYVYQATISATVGEVASSAYEAVADRSFLDADGRYAGYTPAADIAACDATPGSWFWSDGVMYVHRLDQSSPDDNVCVWRQVGCIVAAASSGSKYRFYVRNLKFHGVASVVARAPTEGIQVDTWWDNCEFAYCQTVNGTTGGGGFRGEGGNSYMRNCSFFRNAYDGANYHKHNSTINKCNAFEIGCVGDHNGLTGAGNNQGSTSHDGNSIIRLNCRYFDNEGQNIADVSAGTTSFNWNVDCQNSRKATNSRNYAFDGVSGTAYAYLGSCKSGGRADFDLVTSNSAEVYLYGNIDWRYSGPAGAKRAWHPFG